MAAKKKNGTQSGRGAAGRSWNPTVVVRIKPDGGAALAGARQYLLRKLLPLLKEVRQEPEADPSARCDLC